MTLLNASGRGDTPARRLGRTDGTPGDRRFVVFQVEVAARSGDLEDDEAPWP